MVIGGALHRIQKGNTMNKKLTEPQADSRVATVSELPKCDFCDGTARYDGATNLGPWAFMCQTDWLAHGIGLGLGKGQLLLKEKGN